MRLDGQAVLIVPFGATESAIARFLDESGEWLRRQTARLARFKNDHFLPRSRREYLARREEARQFVAAALDRLGPPYGYRWRRVSIKDLRRNWGSCSEKSNLNFNWKIVLLPSRLAEYVVFHELCHLEAFDHSPRFWQLVSREFPDHRSLRRELRRYHL
jgi:predicted metal-dependent hydrolase